MNSEERAAMEWYGAPQRYGFLPTARIWHDHEMRRLFEPVAVFTAFPLMGLLYLLRLTIALPWVVVAIVMLGYPYFLMGLVERYVRRRKWRPVQPRRASHAVSVAAPPDRRILRATVGACGALALAAALEAGELVLLAIVGLGVATVMTVCWRMMMPESDMP